MVAANINEYLAEHGIKQTWLAEQLGVPVSTLNGILNGKVMMKADMFIRVCRVLKVSPETFVKKEVSA